PPPGELSGPAFDVARRLGRELQQTAEYRRLTEAERAFLLDEGVQAWIEELRSTEERLRAFAYATPEEGRQLQRRIDELKERIAARPSHAAFLEARERFDRLMGLVLDTIHLGFSGRRREEAGCGTTGRVCGCGSGLYLPSRPRIQRLLAVNG
ncbi:MAG TPA: YlbF family regulator, partial [Bacillota bacterium]